MGAIMVVLPVFIVLWLIARERVLYGKQREHRRDRI